MSQLKKYSLSLTLTAFVGASCVMSFLSRKKAENSKLDSDVLRYTTVSNGLGVVPFIVIPALAGAFILETIL